MKVGLLGYGSIGRRHAVNADELGHEVAVHDPGMVSGRREAILRWADKVIIASPTSQHRADIIDCHIFKKPMLVEKPISDSMAYVLTNQYVRLVGYNLRYHALVKTMKRAIEDGKIGTPRWANIVLGQYSNKPDYLRDGVLLNWSHEIDLALFLLGHATLVGKNVRQTGGYQDMADLLLRHTNGCSSTIHLDYISAREVRSGTIVGDKGMIEYDLVTGSLAISNEPQRFPSDAFNASYREELRAFLDDDIGDGCTGAEAVDVLNICLEAAR